MKNAKAASYLGRYPAPRAHLPMKLGTLNLLVPSSFFLLLLLDASHIIVHHHQATVHPLHLRGVVKDPDPRFERGMNRADMGA